MKAKLDEKNIAVRLRQKGYSYSEIQNVTNVSKSSLSVWLRNIELGKEAKRILRSKLQSTFLFGARARHNQKIMKLSQIQKESIAQIPNISEENLFLMGIMLYWAEGSKQKIGDPAQRVEFSNSDPNMCRLFVR